MDPLFEGGYPYSSTTEKHKFSWGSNKARKFSWNKKSLIKMTNLDILVHLAYFKLSSGWPVGKTDFNENPVVSLDLGLDLGPLRQRFLFKYTSSDLLFRMRKG